MSAVPSGADAVAVAAHAPRPMRAVPLWLPLLIAAALMLWGFVRLQAGASHAGGSDYLPHATRVLAWSDIISIYGRPYMASHPMPYTSTGLFEYPVLTGIVFYLAGFVRYVPDATPAFLVNYLLLAACGLGVLALLSRRPGANPWLFALSPALVLYTGANWDFLAILPGFAALLLFERPGQQDRGPATSRREVLAALLLGVSVWLKFFSILWLPLILAERARRGAWASCARIVAVFAAFSVACNAPFALRNRDAWGVFFTFNRQRSPEVNFWTIIRDSLRDTGTINTLSLGLVAIAVAALMALQWRRRADITVPAAALLTTWFFVVNKVYSPQYFLWLLPFVALLAAPLWLAVALAFTDVIYYTCSFQIVHFNCPSACGPQLQEISNWDFDHVLMPAMELRELVFVLFMGWIAAVYLIARWGGADSTSA